MAVYLGPLAPFELDMEPKSIPDSVLDEIMSNCIPVQRETARLEREEAERSRPRVSVSADTFDKLRRLAMAALEGGHVAESGEATSVENREPRHIRLK